MLGLVLYHAFQSSVKEAQTVVKPLRHRRDPQDMFSVISPKLASEEEGLSGRANLPLKSYVTSI